MSGIPDDGNSGGDFGDKRQARPGTLWGMPVKVLLRIAFLIAILLAVLYFRAISHTLAIGINHLFGVSSAQSEPQSETPSRAADSKRSRPLIVEMPKPSETQRPADTQ